LALLVLGVVVVVAAVVVCEFLHAKPFGGVACSLGPYQGWASGLSVCVWASAWGRSCRRRRLRFFARQALRRGGVQRLSLLVLGAFAVVDAGVVCVFLHAKPFGGVACFAWPFHGLGVWCECVCVCVCGCECVCVCYSGGWLWRVATYCWTACQGLLSRTGAGDHPDGRRVGPLIALRAWTSSCRRRSLFFLHV
jgi:hypothetical protein